MEQQHTIKLEREGDGWSITCDTLGIASQGSTVREALWMAWDCYYTHEGTLIDLGEQPYPL